MDEKQLREVIAGDVVPLLEFLVASLPDKSSEELVAYLQLISGDTPGGECALTMLAGQLRKKPQVARKIA